MKSLAGAEPDKKPDYRTQSLTELNKLEQKVILLNEMLDNVDTARGERFASGDAYDVCVFSLYYVVIIEDFRSKSVVSCQPPDPKYRNGYRMPSRVIRKC